MQNPQQKDDMYIPKVHMPEVDLNEEIKHVDLSRYRIKKVSKRTLPYETKSICPECLLGENKVNVIPATVYEDNGKAMFKKSCPEHGEVVDVYWSDVKLFKRALEYWYESVG